MAASAEKHSRRNGGGSSNGAAPASAPTSKLHQESAGGPDGLERARGVELARAIADADSVWLPYDDLRRWESNPRKNDPGVPSMMVSIVRFGFVTPVVVWRAANRMVAGDRRIKAMRRLCSGAEEHDASGRIVAGPNFVAKGAPGAGLVRVVFHDFESEEEADLYALLDNKFAELTEWDGKRLDEVLARYDADDRAFAGFHEEKIAGGQELEVRAVDVDVLARESFWLNVRGPLPSQPDVLDKLREALSGIDGVEVQIGSG